MNIEGVDLYGGTRHSSATELKKHFSIDEIRRYGTLHNTNKAFDRYLQCDNTDSKKLYEKASANKLLNIKIRENL